jgi:hypothetical protein
VYVVLLYIVSFVLKVSQFHTDLSLLDLNGNEIMRKTISVNDPLRYEGITIYQADWSFSALQILKDGEGPFNLAIAPLKINGDKKLFGTFLPMGDTDSPNIKGMHVSFLTSSDCGGLYFFLSFFGNSFLS